MFDSTDVDWLERRARFVLDGWRVRVQYPVDGRRLLIARPTGGTDDDRMFLWIPAHVAGQSEASRHTWPHFDWSGRDTLVRNILYYPLGDMLNGLMVMTLDQRKLVMRTMFIGVDWDHFTVDPRNKARAPWAQLLASVFLACLEQGVSGRLDRAQVRDRVGEQLLRPAASAIGANVD